MDKDMIYSSKGIMEAKVMSIIAHRRIDFSPNIYQPVHEYNFSNAKAKFRGARLSPKGRDLSRPCSNDTLESPSKITVPSNKGDRV